MIFLAYAREDLEWVTELEQALINRNLPFHRDPPLAVGSPFWREEIRRVLDQTRLMMVVWSDAASSSPWVAHELEGYQGPFVWVPADESPIPAKSDPVLSVSEAADYALRHCEPSGRVSDSRDSGPVGDKVEALRRVEVARQSSHLKQLRPRHPRPPAPPHGSHKLSLADGSTLLRISGNAFVAEQPVTNEQYRTFVAESGWPEPSTWNRVTHRRDRAPVVGITWFEARAYARWYDADLPNETDWRRAASGGHSVREYATASGQLSKDEASFGCSLGLGAPIEVDRNPPNPEGFYAMSGNVWDWCLDAEGPHRVICGGSYADPPRFCRIDARYRNSPLDRDCCVGFRLSLQAAFDRSDFLSKSHGDERHALR